MLAAVAAVGCDAGGGVNGAAAFAPPSVYARWWALTESCSGLTGSLESVQWMSAPARALQAAEGAGTVAYWSSQDNRIVLATNAIANGRIVRHEMLHALSRSRGHPASLFRDRCDGVVRCDEACKGETRGVPRTNTAIRVPVDTLRIAIAVYPARPSSKVDDGAFQVMVSITNPSAHEIVADFRTADPAIAVSVSPGDFRLIADHEIGDPRMAIFGPGERKQYVFDLRAGDPSSRIAFVPGDYRLTGYFDGLFTAPLALVIGR